MSETVEYLALILRKIKSPLYASMERYIFRADESLHSVENFKAVQEHGFAATIDGREVLYGTRNLLLSYGIKPLPQEKEAEQTSRGFSTAYTVIDGTVSAVVFAEYKADPKLKKAVERVGRDITVIVQTEDPLVTEATVQKRYSLTNATMTVATAEETRKLNAVRKRLTKGKKTRPVMLSTKSALGTLSGIEMAQQLSSGADRKRSNQADKRFYGACAHRNSGACRARITLPCLGSCFQYYMDAARYRVVVRIYSEIKV